MTNEEIKEGTELIKNFMEIKPNQIDGFYHYPNLSHAVLNLKNDAWRISIDEFQYHNSFDWIMAVVEKIETLEVIDLHNSYRTNEPRTVTPYRVDMINRNMVEILAYGEKSIVMVDNVKSHRLDNLFRACFLFIKWYNQTQNRHEGKKVL